MQDYRKLYVWKKAHQLALDVFADSAAHFTTPQTWEIRTQVHKAAISIPSNIAEGAGRGSQSDFRRFGFYSLGSTNELEYDFLLATDLRFIPVDLHDRRAAQIAEVRRMLSSFLQSLESGH